MIRGVAPSVIVGLGLISGCTADLPALTDAHSTLDARCTGPYADLVVDFFPASLATPSASLGAPDGASVSLASASVVTVGFIGLGGLTDVSGTDLRIHATVAPNASATVRLASSDLQFRFAGTLTTSVNEFDLAVSEITSAVYARVTDVNGSIEIDSFEAIHDKCR